MIPQFQFFGEMIRFATGPSHQTWAVIAFVIGPLPILIHLLATHNATFESFFVGKCGCNDDRFVNVVEILGGAAGFSFGIIEYWLATNWLSNMGWFTDYTLGVAKMAFWLSAIQIAYFLLQLIFKRGKILKALADKNQSILVTLAHFLGCGWVTATGLFWWLYWLQWIAKKIDSRSSELFIRLIRDLEVPFKWIASLPANIALNLPTLIILQRFMAPGFEWKVTNEKAASH